MSNTYDEHDEQDGLDDPDSIPVAPPPQIASAKATYTRNLGHTIVQVTYNGSEHVQLAVQDRNLRHDVTRDNGWLVVQLPMDLWYAMYAHVADRLPCIDPTSPPSQG